VGLSKEKINGGEEIGAMWKDVEVALEKVAEEKRKEKPSQDNLGFGVHFTDHMFMMKWDRENGWHDAKICPCRDLQMHPAAMVFHYGQAVFEGLKAFRGKDDQLFLFRAKDSFERMNASALRMCMPRVPVDKVLQSLKALIYLEREWVPVAEGASLYIRPTMVAVEPALGVRPSDAYCFYIILSPVGAYYKEGFNPTKIYVSDEHVRAVKGGVGYAKTSGNYAASLFTSELAKKSGCTQVLWLDGCEHKYIEEVGASNIFFKIDNELITPPLDGAILPGLTRDSVIKLSNLWGVDVVERKVSIDEVLEASKNGRLKEAFGTGTAAVISPVGELCYKEKTYLINGGKTGKLSARLFTELQAIQKGEVDDEFKWVVRCG
jgi:branched-chain amino acid aminotransferase